MNVIVNFKIKLMVMTMIQICSVKTNEIIAPESTTQWHENSNRYMFVEAIGQLDMKWRKEGKRLQKGDVAIFKNLHLINHGPSPEGVRGFTFSWSSPLTKQLREPIVLRHEEPLTTKIVEAVSPLFAVNNIAVSSLIDTSQRCQPLFHSLFTRTDHATEMAATAPSGRIDPRLLNVSRYIRENYMLPLTLQTLADLIQCNPVYLSNSYSKVFGISPIKYLQQLKMSRAQDLLAHTNWSISDIAKSLGYVSSSQFAELFKRYYGLTPTKYRQRQLLRAIEH